MREARDGETKITNMNKVIAIQFPVKNVYVTLGALFLEHRKKIVASDNYKVKQHTRRNSLVSVEFN